MALFKTYPQKSVQLIFQLMKGTSSKSMIPPGLEPGTFRVLGERDNHYTTESSGSV